MLLQNEYYNKRKVDEGEENLHQRDWAPAVVDGPTPPLPPQWGESPELILLIDLLRLAHCCCKAAASRVPGGASTAVPEGKERRGEKDDAPPPPKAIRKMPPPDWG